ncbi:MAG: aldo/keto reductase [Tannerella sp.]|jgi:aryl-alcohol dehydrogenase-like predicted oxidoreductase|nr:aldo/keto reductase [Tannerella sp.]
MNRQKLGKSDIYVTAMTVGCWAFGGGDYWGEQSQKDVNDVVNAALDLGVNVFDTAEVYNNGTSETALGQALKGRRNEAVVISKISPSNGRNVREHCTASLRRLDTDYLDVYMLHWPINKLSVEHFTSDSSLITAPPTVEETFAQLYELKNEGLIRSIGVSNFGVGQMREVAATGIEVDVNEITYNIVSRAIEAEIAPYCMDNNIDIIGSMGLMQGLLTGKYQTAADVPPHQAHSRHFAHERGRGTSRHNEVGAEKEVFEVVDALRDIAAGLNVPVSQLAIAWMLKKPFVASALVGSRNINQLKANIEACTLEISDETEALIDRISQPVLDILGNNPDYYEHSSKSRIY